MGNKLRKDSEGNVKLTKLRNFKNSIEQKNIGCDKLSNNSEISDQAPLNQKVIEAENVKWKVFHGENLSKQSKADDQLNTMEVSSSESKAKNAPLNIKKIESYASDISNDITRSVCEHVKEIAHRRGIASGSTEGNETEENANISFTENEKNVDENAEDLSQYRSDADCKEAENESDGNEGLNKDETVKEIKEVINSSEVLTVSEENSASDFQNNLICESDPINFGIYEVTNGKGTVKIRSNPKKYEEIINKFSNELTTAILNNLFFKLKT